MSVLKRILHYLQLWFQRKENAKDTRVFLQDEELVAIIRDVANQQHRTEADVIADLTRIGLNQFRTQNEMESRWASLSHREQQVVALICLGYRNHEIAQALVIAPETVKTHLQRVFDKFNLRSRKELRLALKNWDFREWWEHNRQD